MNNIVSLKWLLARMYESDIVIVDCRFSWASRVPAAKPMRSAIYQEQCIWIWRRIYLRRSGAWRTPSAAGHCGIDGTLSQVGISNESRVVAYDDQGGAMASRLWWLLKYLGHEAVYVLDEGFGSGRRPVYSTADQQVLIPARFLATVQHHMLVEMDEVKELLGKARHADRLPRSAALSREVEPIDRVAGHIPGAINRFWDEGRRREALGRARTSKRAVRGLMQDGELIVYCGSGVTATPNVMALQEAGFNKVKLYAGSWSDWISYEGNPVAVGTEEGQKDV